MYVFLLTAQFGRCFGGGFPCSLSSSIIAGYTSLHATLFLRHLKLDINGKERTNIETNKNMLYHKQ